MSERLENVADLIERETGIQVKEAQLPALAAALGRVSPGMDADLFLAGLDDPAQGPILLGHLIDQVAIQETFFMREPRELEAVDWHQLLAIAHSHGAPEVTVWVSACASGEEAYSVAILAAEAFGYGRPPVSILATDVSAQALRRAEEAVYSERSTRAVNAERRERFLLQEGRHSVVREQLRSMVRFRRHNLVTDAAPPPGEVPFDLILCRNLLIYFAAQTVETVVRSLESALRPEGQLILGASDRLTSSAQRLSDSPALRPQPLGATGTSPPSRRPLAREARVLRKPLGRTGRADDVPAASRSAGERSLRDALEAANAGQYATAIETTGRVLAADPLDAEAYFVRGLTELAADDPPAATDSLRRALYIDPTFALAAFQLGRAQDRRGDARAARRAYSQALRTLDPDDDRHRDLLEQVDVGDIAAACRTRLAGRRPPESLHVPQGSKGSVDQK